MRTQKIVVGLMIAAALGLMTVGGLLLYAGSSPKIGGTFSAVSNEGPWNFNDAAKDVNLLYIGYAKCPDVCPMALSYSQGAITKLSDQQRANIRFIFVSVDVQHDTAESVSIYAKQFHPDFIGLTGSQQQIDDIVKLFGASYIVEPNPKSYLGYSISHTDRVYILNKKGIVVDTVASPRSVDELLQKIRGNL